MRLPTKLGACLDLAYKLRAERLILQREYDDKLETMKEQEKQIKDHIIASFKKSEIEGAKGQIATGTITTQIVPSVKDWQAVYMWVKQTGAFELFERRLSKTAYRERIEAGEAIPGVETFTVFDLSLTKVGGKTPTKKEK